MTAMDTEAKLVKKKAKNFKKFMEKIEVNPNPVNINNKHYYEAIYTNFKGEVTGTAILSPDEETESEAREAHPILAKYNGLVLNIHEAAVERARVSDVFFKEPLQVIEENKSPALEAGRERIERLDILVKQHKNDYNNLMQTVRETGVISQKNVDDTIRVAIKIDLVHIEVLQIMTRDLYIFEHWMEEMKAAGLWTRLDGNVRTFYHEMLNGEEKNLALLATKDVPEAQHWEDQIKEIYPIGAERIEREITGYRKGLRFPEPW